MKEIQLTRGLVALVDDADYENLLKRRWHAKQNGDGRYYAVGTINGKHVSMHRYIMNAEDGYVIDHINHNGLDNRRDNLRVCTPGQNSANTRKHKNNTTGYKGVSYIKRNDSYRAAITHNGNYLFLGNYKQPEMAAEAYRLAADALNGEYAYRDDKPQKQNKVYALINTDDTGESWRINGIFSSLDSAKEYAESLVYAQEVNFEMVNNGAVRRWEAKIEPVSLSIEEIFIINEYDLDNPNSSAYCLNAPTTEVYNPPLVDRIASPTPKGVYSSGYRGDACG